MTEYVQLHAYTVCTEENFKDVIQRYRAALELAGCKDHEVLSWLSQIKWVTDDIDYYLQGEEGSEEHDRQERRMRRVTTFGSLHPSPFVIAPNAGNAIECTGISFDVWIPFTWIGIDLRFDMETMKDEGKITYKAGIGGTLWHIMNALATAFPESALYFRDTEQAEGAPTQDEDNLWLFDLAIFPHTLAHLFEDAPEGFESIEREESTAFAQSDRWQVLPWVEAASLLE